MGWKLQTARETTNNPRWAITAYVRTQKARPLCGFPHRQLPALHPGLVFRHGRHAGPEHRHRLGNLPTHWSGAITGPGRPGPGPAHHRPGPARRPTLADQVRPPQGRHLQPAGNDPHIPWAGGALACKRSCRPDVRIAPVRRLGHDSGPPCQNGPGAPAGAPRDLPHGRHLEQQPDADGRGRRPGPGWPCGHGQRSLCLRPQRSPAPSSLSPCSRAWTSG